LILIMTLPESVTISVERLMRYCYLAEMTLEACRNVNSKLPLHLTRFGTLAIESASWLYSLFDDRNDSVNLLKIWRNFEHPFEKDLREFEDKLAPFKDELKLVRHRIGFRGSLTRMAEKEGLGILDVDSGRANAFVGIVKDMQLLAVKMIEWFCCQTIKPDGSRDEEKWHQFFRELKKFEKSKG